MSSVGQREVTEDEADIRLDRWFRRHFPWVTQGVVQKLCRTGQVRVDGKRADAATHLSPGQIVRIPPLPEGPAPAPAAPAIDDRLIRALDNMVVYQDDHVIALNKPHGLPVQGGPGIKRHLDGMLDGLRFGAAHRPRLVHRLDRDTSGLLLLARTPGAAAKLAAAFRGRNVQKTYWAVVVGRPDPKSGKIDRPIARVVGPRGGHSQLEDEGDPAITAYETLDTVGKKFSLVALSPYTGRTHQLRVHTASLGTPILGDEKYGVERSQVENFPEKLHLHARALMLPHPAGGILSLEADLPAHMRETFSRLGFDAAPAAKPGRR
jgi:23S rRNA pseudouridine955/2504/2580 synthase